MCVGWEKFLGKSWVRVNTIRRKTGYKKTKISRAKAEDLDFHETSLSNNSTECNPSLSLEALPGEKRWTVGTHPLLLRILMRIPFMESPFHLQNKNQFKHSFPALSSSIHLSPCHLIPLTTVPICAQSPPHQKKCVLFPLSGEIYVSNLDPFSLPKLSGSIVVVCFSFI